MRRWWLLATLFVMVSLPFGGALAKEGGRVVTKRYFTTGEGPTAVACGLPVAPSYAGFGNWTVTFPVLPGERFVDIAIADDTHDRPVIAYVSQHPREGTWICGAQDGIPLVGNLPLVVVLPQSLSAPVIGGTVRATFREFPAVLPRAMKQVKRYESASSVSAAVVSPFLCVGVGTTPCGTTGVTWARLGWDPVSFRVPSRARSFTIALVDDSGLPVRAFVSGDVRLPADPWPNPVCGTSPVEMSLAPGARVIHVWPDSGVWAVPDAITSSALPAGCLLSPVSIPTGGSIGVTFSRKV